MNQSIENNLSCADMTESLAFNHSDSNSENGSDYRVNVLAFKTMPRCLSKDFSECNDSISLDDFSSSNNRHTSLLKCFKCYGLQQRQKNEQQKCRQCLGTSFIPWTHPMVSIFQKLLEKEVPELSTKKQPLKTRKVNRRKTIEIEYGCPQTIKQQSFSIQQDQIPICKGCSKQCNGSYNRCERCPDYSVCCNCYNNKNYYHHHPLTVKSSVSLSDTNGLKNLRKISEQVQALQVSNFGEETMPRCFNCKSQIEQCYVVCINCLKQGNQFIVCDQCYLAKNYSHDPDHQLTIKTSVFGYEGGIIDRKSFRQQDFKQLFKGIPISIQQQPKDQDQPISLQGQSIVNSGSMYNSNILLNLSQSNNNNSYCFGNQFQPFNQSETFKSRDSNLQPQEFYYDNNGYLAIKTCKNTEDEKQDFIESQMQMDMPFRYSKSENEIDTEGKQSIVNTYHPKDVAVESKTNPEDQYIFNDYECDICKVQPIKNKKYHCRECENFDLCQQCYLKRSKQHEHIDFCETDGQELMKKQKQLLAKMKQEKVTSSGISDLTRSKRVQKDGILRKNFC